MKSRRKAVTFCPICTEEVSAVPDATGSVTCTKGHSFSPSVSFTRLSSGEAAPLFSPTPRLPERTQAVSGGRRAIPFYLIVTAAVAALLAAGFGYLLWDDATERNNLRALKERGKWTEGRVTAVTAKKLNAVPIGETFTVTYSVDGKDYQGEYENSRLFPFKIGDRERVRYLPDNPSFQRLHEPEEKEWAFSWGRLFEYRVLPICLGILLAVACVGGKALLQKAFSSH